MEEICTNVTLANIGIMVPYSDAIFFLKPGAPFTGSNAYCLFRLAAEYACKGRMFYTDTDMMGLGPASMRLGDDACVLKGGKVPYILREANEHSYNLVGECYIWSHARRTSRHASRIILV